MLALLVLLLLLESLCMQSAQSGSLKVKMYFGNLHPRRQTAAASERASSEPLRTYTTTIGPDQLFGGERTKTMSRTIGFHYFHPRAGDPSPREAIAGVIFPGATLRQSSKAPTRSPAEIPDCCPMNLSCARSRPRTGKCSKWDPWILGQRAGSTDSSGFSETFIKQSRTHWAQRDPVWFHLRPSSIYHALNVVKP